MSEIEAPSVTSLQVGTLADKVESAGLSAPQLDCPVLHHFGPGIYIREVHLPGSVDGNLVVGHRHKLEHLNVLLAGRLTLIDEVTGARRDLVAPFRFTSPPGRKIALVWEDVTWWNVIATDERDVDKLEAMMLDKTEAWQTNELAKVGVDAALRSVDRADFAVFCASVGMSKEHVRTLSEVEADMVPMPDGWPNVTVRPSAIEGRGIFLSSPCGPGAVLAPARVGGRRTPAGRFTNHARDPNAEFLKLANGDIYLVAKRPIAGCVGGGQGEEVTVDYREALAVNLGDPS